MQRSSVQICFKDLVIVRGNLLKGSSRAGRSLAERSDAEILRGDVLYSTGLVCERALPEGLCRNAVQGSPTAVLL